MRSSSFENNIENGCRSLRVLKRRYVTNSKMKNQRANPEMKSRSRNEKLKSVFRNEESDSRSRYEQALTCS